MITLWLDIDNTLYSAQSGISAHMGKKIHQYFLGMGLEEEEASALHLQYYTKYGLALRGLMLHHDVDPLDFDRKCDQSLPLEDLIKPDPALRKLLQDIDRSKIRVWGLTNAYKLHAERVLRILNLDDQIEGLIFCDYTQPNFSCKPDPEFYHQAMEKAGVTDPSTCYFIDDNRANVDAARALGWNVVWFCERGLVHVEGGKVKEIGSERVENGGENVVVVNHLEELRKLAELAGKSTRGVRRPDALRCALRVRNGGHVIAYNSSLALIMEYTPRYAQPFTLTEAKLLDVQTITEEITRLQNSLQRLDETQKMLREYVASIKAGEAPADPEITKALEENVAVIGSQTERISILKMALADIGIIAGSHYDLAPPASTTPAAAETRPPAPTTEDDDGVDL